MTEPEEFLSKHPYHMRGGSQNAATSTLHLRKGSRVVHQCRGSAGLEGERAGQLVNEYGEDKVKFLI